jgi:hypothetical protein
MTELRQITYDWTKRSTPPPGPGDYLVVISRRTGEATGTAYHIVTAREVKRREPRPWPRLRYGAIRVTLDDVYRAIRLDPNARAESLQWHPRRSL